MEMGQIFIAACSALFVCLGVGIPAKILKHISVLFAASFVHFCTVRKGGDVAGMESTSAQLLTGKLLPMLHLSLPGFSAIVNSGMW